MANSTSMSPPMTANYDVYLQRIRGTAITVIGFDILLCTLGTFLNIWFAASILSCRDLRKTFRNQLICNLAISHLFQTLVASPAEIVNLLDLLHPPWNNDVYCRAMAVESIFGYIQSGLADWLILFLVATFVVNSLKIKMAEKRNTRCVVFCKLVLHISPWLLVVAATLLSIIKLFGPDQCHVVHYFQLYLYEAFYTILPTSISIGLLVALYVWRRRQASRGVSVNYDTFEDTDFRSESMAAYIWILVVVLLCEAANLNVLVKHSNERRAHFDLRQTATVMSNFRVLLELLPFLLFQEVRQRVKSWRPWRRLTLTFKVQMAAADEKVPKDDFEETEETSDA